METASAPDPWSIAPAEYPRDHGDADQLAFAARYAALAPSSHNAQPWFFHLRREWIELVADRQRSLPVSDPEDRELVIGCGAALFHFCVAVEFFGHQPDVRPLPDIDDPDLLAAVRLGLPTTPSTEVQRLFAAIPKRHTNRRPFHRRAPPASLVEKLQQLASAHDAWLHPVDGDRKEELASLIAAGDRIQMRDPRFRQELAAWLRPNRDDNIDGMPGYAHGISNALSRMEPLIVRNFDQGDGRAARDRRLAEGAPLLAVLGTDGDGPRAWLAAGEALAHILLYACGEALSASFLNQPIEVARLRGDLKKLLGSNGAPQLILRLGYGDEVRPTPRRPLWQILHRFD